MGVPINQGGLTMKKTLSLLLLIAIAMIMAIVVTGCKNRKLAINQQSSVIKTEQKEQIQARTETAGSKQEKFTSTEKISDQSGTWIWEEWYRKDLASDTINPMKGLLYKRTTFIKNDITSDRIKSSELLENHSEIRDSSVLQQAVTELKSQSKAKNLEAEKSNSWIYGLVVIIIVVGAILFALKRNL
jgi:hypothetical protein